MGNDRYNVIVVGAGPAGISAAYICAQNNLSVALFERGQKPGSKNIFGGVIYREPTSEIIPAFWEEAPVERAITEDILWFMEQNSVVKMGFNNLNFAKPPYNKFSVIRSKFDKWFAKQAADAGADLITSTLVEDIILEKNGLFQKQVTGVILEDGNKIYADVVIIAEGGMVNLVKKAGLQNQEIKPDDFELFVKEELYLPEEKINDRFSLKKNEGKNIGITGYPTSGIIGKAGIWTCKDSLSLIVGGYLNQIIERGMNPYQLLVRIKEHSFIKRLIEGSETIEYYSHIIPKTGVDNMPQMYDSGVMVVGDALMNVGGQGTALAMLSGKYAADTAVQAHAKGDFSSEILSAYATKLKNSYIMKNNTPKTKEKNYYQEFSDSDVLLSKVLNKVASQFFIHSMDTHQSKIKDMIEELQTLQPSKKNIIDNKKTGEIPYSD